MKVRELIQELGKIVNQELEVVILSDDITFKSVDEVEKDKLGFDNKEVRECVRLK